MLKAIRAATVLSLLGLVALASVTAFVPDGVCEERRCEGAALTTDDPFRAYDANRELIESENEMKDHRMMWLLTIQGLLFASFFLLWSRKRLGRSDIGERLRATGAREIGILYSMGVFTSVSVGIALFFALNAIKCIVTSTPDAGQPYVIGLSHGPVPAWVHYLLPWNSLPVLFVVAWHLLVETAAGGQSSLEPSRPGGSPEEGSDDAADPEHQQ